MITINFSQYEDFMKEFSAVLQRRLNDDNLRGLQKSEIFRIVLEEDFNIAVSVMPQEPFWVAHISERDFTHFALKYC